MQFDTSTEKIIVAVTSEKSLFKLMGVEKRYEIKPLLPKMAIPCRQKGIEKIIKIHGNHLVLDSNQQQTYRKNSGIRNSPKAIIKK